MSKRRRRHDWPLSPRSVPCGISTITTLLLYRNYFTDSGRLRAGITGAAQLGAPPLDHRPDSFVSPWLADTPRTTHDRAMTASARFDRLETQRLIMRRWQESDRAPFAELNADPETMRFFPNTLDRAASNALIEMIETRFDRQGFGFWALEVAATGTFIGFTGLNPLPDGLPGAGGMEVGWRLARHAWHHGYATEAARAALGVAFHNLGLPEIWSMTAVLNLPSQAVMRRLGLTETTRFDQPRIPPGDPLRPHVAYHGTRP